MTIDIRFRPPYGSFLDLHVFSGESSTARPGQVDRSSIPSVSELSMDLLQEELAEAGVTAALALGRRAHAPWQGVKNEDVVRFAEEHGGGFYAVPGLDLSDRNDTIQEIDKYAGHPRVKAFHFEPGWASRPMYPDDMALAYAYTKVADAGLPIIISAGGTIGPDIGYVDPVRIHRVAKAFPTLDIVVAHGGWPHVMQALAVAYDCENVYLSPDMYLNMPNTPGQLEYVAAAKSYLSDRLLFGTAYPARPIPESVKDFKSLPFGSEELMEKVLHLNAARLFGI